MPLMAPSFMLVFLLKLHKVFNQKIYASDAIVWLNVQIVHMYSNWAIFKNFWQVLNIL